MFSHQEHEDLTESVWFDEEESNEVKDILSSTDEVYQTKRTRKLSLIKALGAFSILSKFAGVQTVPTIAA